MKIPEELLKSAKKYHYDTFLMQGVEIPHLCVEKSKILSSFCCPGLEISAKKYSQEVKIKIVVKKGVKIEKPVFLCFGVLGKNGKQIILPEITLEENSEAKILSFCTFPKARKVFHKMEAKIKLKKKTRLIYKEIHYHGDKFGTKIETDFKIFVGQESGFESKFVLDKGSVGKLKVNLRAQLEKESFCKVLNKVIGRGKKDEIEIYDKILLNGESSSSLNKLRGVMINGGKMFFKGETEVTKKAKNARGHIDCQEIVVGENSMVQSTPIIIVKNPEARVTHEASIGKINQKELETLMSRGLSEKEAIDFVIKGMIE